MCDLKVLTRAALLKITMTGNRNYGVCRYCFEKKEIPFFQEMTRKERIKSLERFIRNFLETHYGRHMRENKIKGQEKYS